MSTAEANSAGGGVGAEPRVPLSPRAKNRVGWFVENGPVPKEAPGAIEDVEACLSEHCINV